MTGTTVIPVPGTDPYDVTVGRGVIDQLPDALGSRVAKVLIVHPPTLGARAAQLRESLLGQFEVLLAEVPDAEDAKRVEVAAFCWQIMGQTDFTRTDAVVGFGGGATTDLAGFVAATWLRGVRLVQVPTTVNGMVDAAIGGKTGVNTAEGKNLVGAFYAPAAVLVDLDLLDGLPRNELLAGFAEVVKCGFIGEPEILDIVEADVDRATDPATDEFRRCIELAIRLKARVVGEDFKESGLREILNYGHTLGPRDRARRAVPLAPRSGDLGGDGVRRRARPDRGDPRRRGGRPAPPHPGVAHPAHHLPGRPVEDPAGDDAAGQEGARRHDAVHRARGDRQADHARGTRGGAAVRGVPGGRQLTIGQALAGFALLAAVLTIIPGLDTALVLRATLAQGRRHAIATALGICSGAFVWGAAAAVGATALLAASELAFTVLKLAGAVYLVALGITMFVRTFQRRERPVAPLEAAPRSLWAAYGRGALTNLLNPKVGVFYIAVIPQFIPEGVPALPMGLLLALVHVLESVVWFSAIILATGFARRWLAGERARRWIDRVTGGILVGFGVALALESRQLGSTP